MNLAAYVANNLVTYLSVAGFFGLTNMEQSQKYQTLVTPAAWSFRIWGLIFLWEGLFAMAQLFPTFRGSKVVMQISPWWWAACCCQISWAVAFAQDQVTTSVAFLLGILACLLGISWSTDGLPLTIGEYFLLRAPLSLQLGWIIVASAINISVQADSVKSPQGTLLALAIISDAVVLVVTTIFTFAVRSPDAVIGFVAAWAFAGIHSELGNPLNLNDPTRFNASRWDASVLQGLQAASFVMGVLSFVLAVAAAALRLRGTSRRHA